MNLYDTKVLTCTKCGSSIGEIDWDAQVIRVLCSKCTNALPAADKIIYTVSHYQNNHARKEILQTLQL